MLPELPVAAETIVGVSGEHFHEADPWVRTVDEELYVHPWNQDWKTKKEFLEWRNQGWQTDLEFSDLSMLTSKSCQPKVLELLETSVGNIKECITVQPPDGEWCSAPSTSIALTEEGEVWRYEKYLPCATFFVLMLPVFVAGGLILGLMIILLKKMIISATK